MVSISDLEVGQKLEFSSGPFTRSGIFAYGKASKDENGIHMSDDFAVKMKLNGVIAHGMYSFGTAIAALDNWLAGSGKITTIECQMRGMVRPGDCVYTIYTVKEIDGNKVTFDWEQFTKMPLAILKDGEVVQTFEAEDRSWYDAAKDTVKEEEITEPLKWLSTTWDEEKGFPSGKYTESVEEIGEGTLRFVWRQSLLGLGTEIVLNE
jgi:acyl dehydratase